MGLLIVGRRDAYAYHTGSQWIAKREPLRLGDFKTHLFGNRCLGTYLLDPDSNVRTMVFDIDLLSANGPSDARRGAPYFNIEDPEDHENATRFLADSLPELNLEIKRGDVEAALHDPDHPAFRWAGSLILSSVWQLMREVYNVLGLTSMPIITGGGAHVFVPLGTLMPAAEVRAMAHSVMDRVGTFTRRSESFYANSEDDPSVEIEIFPKQDTLTDPESLGNLIRLPFGMHETGMRTYALDPRLPVLPSWKLPRSSSIDALRRQAALLDLEWKMSA